MRIKLIILALCLVPVAFAQNKVLVTDTVYLANGSTASGSITLSWPAFTSADGFTIAKGSVKVNLVSGVFNAWLIPTEGATPAGISYTAVYNLQNQNSYTEYWTIPATGPVTVAQVRTTPVPTPTVTFGEHQLALGAGLASLLGLWRRSSDPVATAEGQCYWDGLAHVIKCADQNLVFQALAGGGTTPDATAIVKGKLKLAGDLSGTADAPSVTGLLNKVDKQTGIIYAQNYASIQAAIDVLRQGDTLILPCGTISGTQLVFRGKSGIVVRGCGRPTEGPTGGTILNFTGDPAILIDGTEDSVFEGFTLNTGAGKTGIRVVWDRMRYDNTGCLGCGLVQQIQTFGAKRNHFRDLTMAGGKYGIWFGDNNGHSGTAAAGGSSTITLDAGASATTGFYAGQMIYLRAGTGLTQFRTITAYDGVTKIATVDTAWATQPNATTVFDIETPQSCAGSCQVSEFWWSHNQIANQTTAGVYITGANTQDTYSSYNSYDGPFECILVDLFGSLSASIADQLNSGGGTGGIHLKQSQGFPLTVVSPQGSITSAVWSIYNEVAFMPVTVVGGTLSGVTGAIKATQAGDLMVLGTSFPNSALVDVIIPPDLYGNNARPALKINGVSTVLGEQAINTIGRISFQPPQPSPERWIGLSQAGDGNLVLNALSPQGAGFAGRQMQLFPGSTSEWGRLEVEGSLVLKNDLAGVNENSALSPGYGIKWASSSDGKTWFAKARSGLRVGTTGMVFSNGAADTPVLELSSSDFTTILRAGTAINSSTFGLTFHSKNSAGADQFVTARSEPSGTNLEWTLRGIGSTGDNAIFGVHSTRKLRFCAADVNAYCATFDATGLTASRTITIPDAASNTVRPATCAGTDKVSAIGSDGVVTCSVDQNAVTSVFGRTGAVTAQSGDYSASQVTNAWDITTYADVSEIAAPVAPAVGKERVYAKSGSGLCAKDSGGTERCTGASGGGTTVQVNGAGHSSTVNFNDATPAASGEATNAVWQADAANPDHISANYTAVTTVQDEGTAVTQRKTVNFVGPSVLVDDSSATTRVRISDPATMAFVSDDWLGFGGSGSTYGQLGWTCVGTLSYLIAIAGHPGVARTSTGATLGTNAYCYLPAVAANNVEFDLSETFDSTFIFRATSTTAAKALFRIGQSGGTNTDNPPANSIYLEHCNDVLTTNGCSGTADTNWFFALRVSGATSRIDTTVAYTSGNWLNVRIKRVDANTVGFSLNGGSLQCFTSAVSLPAGCSGGSTGITQPTGGVRPFFFTRNNEAAAETLDPDYFHLLITGLSR